MTPGEERRQWAYEYISRCASPPPLYGSDEFMALPEGPEKVAATVIAAEGWRSLYVAHLHVEKAAEDEEYIARRDAHRQSWTGTGFRSDPAIAAEIEREWESWAGGAA